jgi:hypothetical protein
VARYWRTPSTKRKKQHHVPAPVARFARKVITMLNESLPMGTWSLARYETLQPGWPLTSGWEKFAGLKVCQEFASYTELRESAFDILLGRDTNTRRNHPVFLELLHFPPFARFQPCPRVNLKLACWLQEWVSKFWKWQCEAAGKFGFIRVPTVHEFCIENWVRC